MTPNFLCLIILAMPLVVAAFAAWAERRPGSARAYGLYADDGVADVGHDSTLFR
jgi:hypothetical protein